MKKTILTFVIATCCLLLAAQAQNWTWVSRGGGSTADYGRALAIDNLGNQYVVGHFTGTAYFGGSGLSSAGDTDIFIGKLDPSGMWLWAKRAGGTAGDAGLGVATDNAGNIYVSGYFQGTATFGTTTLTSFGMLDIFTAKLDGAGNWLWVAQAGGPGDDYGHGIIVDSLGYIHLTGCFTGYASFGGIYPTYSGLTDIFVATLSPSGSWTSCVSAYGYDNDYGHGITLDSSGNTYVTGTIKGLSFFGSYTLMGAGAADIFVAKLSPTGTWLWARQAGGTGDEDCQSVALDASGNVYIAGLFAGTATFGPTSLASSGGQDVFAAKFGPAGNWLWAKKAGGTGNDLALSLAVGPQNVPYLAGAFAGTCVFGGISLASAGSYDIFLGRLDPSGNWCWAEKAGGTGDDRCYCLALDSSSNAFLAGSFEGTAVFGPVNSVGAGSSDVFIAKHLASLTAQIGVGTASNNSVSYPAVYGGWFKNAREQYLIGAGELADRGAGAGNIYSVSFDVAAVNSCGALPNLKIHLGQTAETQLGTTFLTGLTQVFSVASYLPVAGRNTHVFSTPFAWDGVSNLVVQVSFDMQANYTTNTSTYYSSTSPLLRTLYFCSDSTHWYDYPTGSLTSNRPNVTFNLTPGGAVAPFPAILYTPVNGAAMQTLSTTLNWVGGGGNPQTNKIYFGTQNPPPYLASVAGNVTSFAPSLAYGQTYFWQVVPHNALGDAVNCPVWSFSTHPDPQIQTLPYTQNFDSATVPYLPFDWSKIVASSSTGATVQLYSDPNLAHSAPNLVLMYNESDANATLILAGPPLSPAIGLNNAGVVFWARGYAGNWPLSVGVMSDPANAATFTEIASLTLNDSMAEYVVSLANYTGAGNRIAFRHGNGGTDRYILIDDVNIVALVQHDLACRSLAGDEFIIAGAAATFSATVYNQGRSTETSYSVKLLDSDNNELVSSPGVTLAPAATASIPLNWIPSVSGNVAVHARVQLIGDANPANDDSPAISVHISPANAALVTIGSGTDNLRLPVNTFYGFTYSQCIYLQSELNLVEHRIDRIYYHWNGFEYADLSDQWVVYMGHTSASAFTSTTNWLPLSSLTQVFSGQVLTSAVPGWVEIVLDTPFIYDNVNNLVVAVEENEAGYDSSAGFFYCTSSSGNRSLRFYDDATNPSPGSPPAGTLLAGFANLRLECTPLAPVYAIDPGNWNFGQAELLNPSLKQYAVSNAGWGSIQIGSGDVYILPGSDPEGNFTLTGLSLPVNLGHYQQLLFNVVFTPQSLGYKTATLAVADNLNRTLHTYGLSGTGLVEMGFAAIALNGTVVGGNNVNLNWVSSYTDGYGNWIHWDDGAYSSAIGGSAAVFSVAQKFTTANLAAYAGQMLQTVKFYPAAAANSFTVKVWTGNDGNVAPTLLVASQTVYNPQIAAWNEITLATPVPVSGTQALYIGYEVDASTGYPAGTDNGPAVAGYGDLIFWGGAWSSMYTSYGLNYNWLVQGYVTPGAPGKSLPLMSVPVISAERDDRSVVPILPLAAPPDLAVASSENMSGERGLQGYNVYRDGILLTPTPIAAVSYTDPNVANGTRNYQVEAVYVTHTVSSNVLSLTIPMLDLPFSEDWSSGSHLTQQWSLVGTNWSVFGDYGYPAPAMLFQYYPSVTNYNLYCTSQWLDGNYPGAITLSFDVMLNNYGLTAINYMSWEVFDGGVWHTLGTLSSAGGNIPWTTYNYDITTYASGHSFLIRFWAHGANSWYINFWIIDNISINIPFANTPPATVSIAGSGENVTLSWSAVYGASWYAVYASDDPEDFPDLPLTTVAGSVTSVILPAEQKKFFKVTSGAGSNPYVAK